MILQKFIQQLPDVKSFANNHCWWVGFSGGLDSTVLLHLLKSAYPNLNLAAIHVNHQISPNANAWQQHCKEVCHQLSMTLVVEKVAVENQGKGVEDAARAARYAIFDRYMLPNDFLVTAHHADDQAETLLLRLLRGTGSRGLAGIAAERILNPHMNTTILRPLLSFSRDELLAYAAHHQLKWIEDESNFSAEYDRNYLRLQVMPLLQARWPSMQKKWHQTAQLCAETESLLIEMATADLQSMNQCNERVGQSICRKRFSNLSIPRQHNLLRYWLSVQGYSIPEQQHWQQISAQLFSEKTDSSINLQWGNVSLRVYQDKIFALPLVMPELTLSMIEGITDSSTHLLRADLPNLQIKNRQGGERCRPAGRHHSQTLKKCLQEFGLEPWLRDSVPLIYSDNHLVAVGDLWVCAEYLADENARGLKLKWRV